MYPPLESLFSVKSLNIFKHLKTTKVKKKFPCKLFTFILFIVIVYLSSLTILSIGWGTTYLIKGGDTMKKLRKNWRKSIVSPVLYTNEKW